MKRLRRSPGDRGSPFLLDLRRAEYHDRDASPHVTNALLQLGLARRAVRHRDRATACEQYGACLGSWERANAAQRDRWREEVSLVARERMEALEWLDRRRHGRARREGR